MRNPIVFAVELVVGMTVAFGGSFLVAKAGGKLNAKANGDIRAAAAQERIAGVLERAYPRSPCTKELASAQHRYSISHPHELVPVCDPW